MEKLFESFEIKGCPIRNRVCFPPMVYYGAGDDSGEVTEKHVEHYRSALISWESGMTARFRG